MAATKKVECIVMSRVVGYLSPVKFWHAGKRAEFNDRKTYNFKKAVEHASK